MSASDLSVLFSDSGVSATADGTTANGNLDQPSDVLIGGEVLSTDYEFTCKADDFGGLVYGDSMVVDSVSYTVRATRLIDDGNLVQISLQKTS